MQFVWEECAIDKLISKLAKFSITGNTRLYSKTRYCIFYITSLQYSQPKHKIASNLTWLNLSSYTRLSSTCNYSEVFSFVGASEALREAPGSSSRVGLHSSHASQLALNWKRTAQPNNRKSSKTQTLRPDFEKCCENTNGKNSWDFRVVGFFWKGPRNSTKATVR